MLSNQKVSASSYVGVRFRFAALLALLMSISFVDLNSQARPESTVSNQNPKSTVNAQTKASPTKKIDTPGSGTTAVDGTKTPSVISSNITTHTTYWTELDETVTVCVQNLGTWIAAGNDANKLRLVLGGFMVDDIEPILSPTGQDYLNFPLRIKTGSDVERKTWANIINAARNSNGKVTIALGTVDHRQTFESNVFVTLSLYPWYTPYVLAFIVLLFVALIVIGWKSSMLRDTTLGTPTGGRPPLSLGRVQMAWWFFLVITSFLYLWLITSQSYTPTGSALALMGISAATAFSAAVIDKDKVGRARAQKDELTVEQAAVAARIAELNKANPAPGTELDKELQLRLNRQKEIAAAIANLVPLPGSVKSDGLLDLISDAAGISFHRFQIVIWSLVLGAVFVVAVHRDLAMPEFNPTLLGLMGLSAGTYVGLKFPEKVG